MKVPLPGVPREARDLVRIRTYQTLLTSSAWVQKSAELLDSARMLEPSVRAVWKSRLDRDSRTETPAGVLGIYLMLVAYAVENLLKAALVKSRGAEFAEEVVQSGRLPQAIRQASHNLVDLAGLVDFQLTRDEEWLMRRLTRAARWSGRYPVPLAVSDHSTREKLSDGTDVPTAFNWPRDIDLAEALCQRIRKTLAV